MPPKQAAPPAALHPLHILVVEDHPLLAKSLCRYLETHRHRVNRVRDLGTARSLLEDGGFDVLLTDVELPDGDCFKVLDECGEKVPRFVVTMSAFEPRTRRLRMGVREVRQHLVKPFAAEELDMLLEGFTEELAGAGEGAQHADLVPPLVGTVLREAARRRASGELNECAFQGKLDRLIREELSPRSLQLLVRPLPAGVRFLIKHSCTGQVCDLIDCPHDGSI